MPIICKDDLWPFGCNRDKLLADLNIGGFGSLADPLTDCYGLTATQRSIIAYLKAAANSTNGFGSLQVSAPGWVAAGRSPNMCHHYKENKVDFRGDLPTLFRAWDFMRRKFPGVVLLGLNGSGYTADIHLHIGGTWGDKLWRHGFETNKDPSKGFGVVTNSHPYFTRYLEIARRIYGVPVGYVYDGREVGPIATPGAVPFWMIGGALGAGYGYYKERDSGEVDAMRLGVFTVAGVAAGILLDRLRNLVS